MPKKTVTIETKSKPICIRLTDEQTEKIEFIMKTQNMNKTQAIAYCIDSMALFI